jgi:hypothetical protein
MLQRREPIVLGWPVRQHGTVPDRSVRRLVGALLLVTASVIVFGAGQFLHRQGLDWADKFGSVASALIALVVLIGPLFRFAARWMVNPPESTGTSIFDLADDLAATIARQLAKEDRLRRLHDPNPMPVCWRADTSTQIGSFDDILATFQRTPFRRMVVIGAVGSGKSALMIKLARDLIAARITGDPVPIILSASTWNTDEPMMTWVSAELVRRYPALAAQRKLSSGETVTLAGLLAGQSVLPIVDGLDELPTDRRQAAISGLNAHGSDNALVLTSRPDEYRDTVDSVGRTVSRATVITLTPLSTDGVREYLSDAVPHNRRLSDVFRTITDAPTGVLASVLTNPLMLWLTRVTWHDRRANPTDIVELASTGQQQVERYLLDRLLPAVYDADAPWRLRRAQRFLRFLASHPESSAEGIAWWNLMHAAPVLARVGSFVRTGIRAFAGTALVAAAAVSYRENDGLSDLLKPHGWLGSHVLPHLGGVTAALEEFLHGEALVPAPVTTPAFAGWWIVLSVAMAVVRRKPDGIAPRALRWTDRWWLVDVPSNVAGLAVGGGILGGLVGLLLKLFTPFDLPWSAVLWAAACGGLVLAARFERAIVTWADRANSDVPDQALRDDIKVTLLATTTQLVLTTAALHFVVGRALAVMYLVGASAVAIVRQLAGSERRRRTASESYRAARLLLFLGRQMPWRIIQFFADAHRRGVLRQAGATYQFRHLRLMEHLRPPAESTKLSRRLPALRHRLMDALSGAFIPVWTPIGPHPVLRIARSDGSFEFRDPRLGDDLYADETADERVGEEGASGDSWRVYIARSGEHYRILDDKPLPSGLKGDAAIRQNLEGRVNMLDPVHKPFDPADAVNGREVVDVSREHIMIMRSALPVNLVSTGVALLLLVYTLHFKLFTGLACVLAMWVLLWVPFLLELSGRRHDSLILTDRTLVDVHGYITKRTSVLPLDEIRSIRCDQSLLGAICNYGTIRITIEPGSTVLTFSQSPTDIMRGCTGQWEHGSSAQFRLAHLGFRPNPVRLYQKLVTVVDTTHTTRTTRRSHQ